MLDHTQCEPQIAIAGSPLEEVNIALPSPSVTALHTLELARSLTEKLLAYSTGAAPSKADNPEIETIVRSVREKKYGFKSLIHEIVQSAMFQTK